MAVTWPPLPKTISTLLGPATVSVVAVVPEFRTAPPEGSTLMGSWSSVERRVHIRRDMTPATQWLVLFHEQVHGFLDDTGHIFSDDDKERICDLVALGRWTEMRDRLEKRA